MNLTNRFIGDNLTDAPNDPPQRNASGQAKKGVRKHTTTKKRKRNDDTSDENDSDDDMHAHDDHSKEETKTKRNRRAVRVEDCMASMDKHQENALLERVMAESMGMGVRAYRAHVKAQCSSSKSS